MDARLTLEEYTEFCRRLKPKLKNPTELRRGQIMYNTLYNVNPLKAERIGGTDADPFFNNKNILKFIHVIRPL